MERFDEYIEEQDKGEGRARLARRIQSNVRSTNHYSDGELRIRNRTSEQIGNVHHILHVKDDPVYDKLDHLVRVLNIEENRELVNEAIRLQGEIESRKMCQREYWELNNSNIESVTAMLSKRMYGMQTESA